MPVFNATEKNPANFYSDHKFTFAKNQSVSISKSNKNELLWEYPLTCFVVSVTKDNSHPLQEAAAVNGQNKQADISISKLMKSFTEFLRLSLQSLSVRELTQKLERLMNENQFRKKHKFQFTQLTKREVEVLEKLALGYSNKEIACQLYISLETAKHHRKIIKSKLEATSTADLIRYAQAFDLI